MAACITRTVTGRAMFTGRTTVIGLRFIDHIPVTACMAVMGIVPVEAGHMGAGIVPVVAMGTASAERRAADQSTQESLSSMR